MAIYDCFQYFNEDHIVDLRLHILDKFVDHFIISESTKTHQGKDKKINFDKNNFPKFKHKIKLIIADYKEDILVNNNSPYKEVEILKINSSKAENDLGWKAKIEIPKIIQLIVQWEKHHKKENSPEYSLNEVGDYLNL